MSHWDPELLIALFVICVFVIVILPRLGPSEAPPLDTHHEPHDLPEWSALSSISDETTDRR